MTICSLFLSGFFLEIPSQQMNMSQNSSCNTQSLLQNLCLVVICEHVLWCVTTIGINQLRILLHNLLCWEMTNIIKFTGQYQPLSFTYLHQFLFQIREISVYIFNIYYDADRRLMYLSDDAYVR
jgi:hypothetical protein